MIRKLPSMFTLKPVDPDTQKSQVRLLQTTLVSLEAICISYIIWDILNGFEFDFFAFMSTVCVLIGGLYWLLARGYRDLVGWTLPAMLIAATSYSIIRFGSLRDVSLTAYFFILILTTLTMGESATMLLGGAIIAITGWIYFAETQQIIQSSRTQTELFDWGILVTTLLITIFLLRSGYRQIVTGINRARENALDLDRYNAELETRVRERTEELNRITERAAESQKQLQLAVEAGNVGLWSWNLATNTVYFSPEWKAQIGYRDGELPNEYIEWESRIHPDDFAHTIKSLNEALQPPYPTHRTEFRLRHKDGHYCWILAQGSIQNDQHGTPTRMYGIHVDVTQNKQNEIALKQNMELTKNIMDNTTALIIAKQYRSGSEGKYLFVNKPYAERFGMTAEEMIGKSPFDIYPADVARHLEEDDRQVYESGVIRQLEEKIIVDGKERFLFSNKFPLRELDGKPYGMCIIGTDITDLKHAEEQVHRSLIEKETMLREIHHRVKNNLQVISSLLYLQLQGNQAPLLYDALRESRDRIEAMALIHEKLYRSPDLAQIPFAGYVNELIQSLLKSYGGLDSKVGFIVEAENVVLDINTAIPCGLIVNEVISNSLKHAFPDGMTGTLRVQLRTDSETTYRITLSDDGVGLPPDFEERAKRSLGIKLIERLVDQLQGSVTRSASERGTVYEIVFSKRD